MFWRCLLRPSNKGISFSLGWKYQILVLSGDDAKTWLRSLCCLQKSGRSRWFSTPWPWLTTSEFDHGILRCYCWQHFKCKCGRSFGNYPPKKRVHISCLLKNFVNKQHREVNFRRGRCFVPCFPSAERSWNRSETSCGKASAVFSCRWATQLNDTSCLAPFFRVEEVFAHNQSRRTLLRYHWE